MPPGRYGPARHPGYRVIASFDADVPFLAEPTPPFEIRPAEDTVVNLRWTGSPHALRGQVKEPSHRPVPHAGVIVEVADPSSRKQTMGDASGAFDVLGVPDQPLRIWASHLHGIDATTEPTVVLPGPGSDLVVTLPATYRREGALIDAQTGLADTRWRGVFLFPPAVTPRLFPVDGGRFVIAGLPPGTYRLGTAEESPDFIVGVAGDPAHPVTVTLTLR